MPLILPKVTIAAAVSLVAGPISFIEPGPNRDLILQANFLYGAGGTSVDAWVQSTLDGGTTWYDIANFHFTTAAAVKLANLSSGTPVTTLVTPGSGALSANSVLDGLIGDQLRVLYTSVGTYTGATALSVFASGTRLRAN